VERAAGDDDAAGPMLNDALSEEAPGFGFGLGLGGLGRPLGALVLVTLPAALVALATALVAIPGMVLYHFWHRRPGAGEGFMDLWRERCWGRGW